MGKFNARHKYNFVSSKQRRKIMTDTRTLKREDNVFATLIHHGKTLKSIVGHNFTEINDIIKIICYNCNNFRGLAQLNIRNQSQGWSMNMLLRINNQTTTKTLSEPKPLLDGLQYRLAL